MYGSLWLLRSVKRVKNVRILISREKATEDHGNIKNPKSIGYTFNLPIEEKRNSKNKNQMQVG